MKSTMANIRGTFFTNKPVEIDYDKSLKIVSELKSYQLYPFPVNGFSFQIGPNGMTPASLSSYVFRNSDNSLNISIGPDRIDVNRCQGYNDIEKSFKGLSELTCQVINAFQSCVEFRITRLALASTWILASDNLKTVSTQFLHEDIKDDLIEWENRRVERSMLASIGTPVNYGYKIARSFLKLPVEQTLTDRVFIETDINTVPLPPEFLDKIKTVAFFTQAVAVSSDILSKYLK